jgi:hypothetical protein
VLTQEVGKLVRSRRHLRERAEALRAVFLDDMQGGVVVSGSDDIEVIERPVEAIDSWPPEIANGRPMVRAMAKQKVARLQKRLTGPAQASHCPRSLQNTEPYRARYGTSGSRRDLRRFLEGGSSAWTRTRNPPVNSRMLYH